MKLQTVVLCAVAVTFVSVSQQEASAGGRRGRVVQTASMETTPGPLMTTPSTIIPTRDEIRAVPAPGGGRLIGYGLNLHPGGRLVRMMLSR